MWPSQTEPVAALAIVVLALLLLGWFARRAHKTPGFPFRPIAAFQTMQGLLGRTVESGRKVHLSLGSSGLGDEQTAAASAGLTVLRSFAEQGAAFGHSTVVTVADPILMLVAQDILYRAYQRSGLGASYRSTDVRLIAPDPAAYAVGAQEEINQERVAANVMVGHFGDEYLLLGEAGAQRGITQMVGSNTVEAQPLMMATSDRALMGEDLFAAGAYLTRRPEQVASLHVQDVLRVLLVVAILVAVAIKTFG
jgi:hypothetical protein